MRIFVACLLLFSISVFANAQQPKQLTNDDFVTVTTKTTDTNSTEEAKFSLITLERSGCLGPCPVYKLTVYGNGKVVYKGEKNVKIVGERTANLEKEQLAQLAKEFEKVGYFNLNDNYEGGPTDGSSATTSIAIGNRKKTIKHYHPSPDSPNVLKELENKIDAIVNSGRWIQE